MNLLSVHDVSDSKLKKLFNLADWHRLRDEIKNHQLVDHLDLLKCHVLGTLFFEPSTRTRWSFESAMIKLGGKVISSSSAECSSQAKGESLEDTINICCQYVDFLVIRSSEPLTNNGECNFCIPDKRIINAGDGNNEHPTQAILDAYTIWRHLGKIDTLRIGVIGDLVQSRTIHSLVSLLGRNASNSFTFYNPLGGKLPREREPLSPIFHCDHEDQFHYEDEDFDVVYLNRIQNERWDKGMEYTPYILTRENLNVMKPKIVMNPGPRKEELPFLDDPRIVFEEQALNGLFVRMAILSDLFSCNNE